MVEIPYSSGNGRLTSAQGTISESIHIAIIYFRQLENLIKI